MASNKDRLTQSPRALRDSTNDPEKHSKGEYNVDMKQPSKSDGINDRAWKIEQDRDASGWPPATRGG